MERRVGNSVCLWLILVAHPLWMTMVLANMEGDALHNLRTNLEDPNNVLQSWDPTLVNPCTWFHVTCNNENSVIRVDLGNAALSGQLVPQLGLLKNLQYFYQLSAMVEPRPWAIRLLGALYSLHLEDLSLSYFTGNTNTLN
ncbi:hypothetical protein TB2_033728 [Malus domestica]